MVRLNRVGIIGHGWGSLVHVPAFRSAAGYDVVALCGREPSKLEGVGKRWGIDDLSASWREFVRRDDLDVISVATPVTEHRPMVEAALEAGKHVLCEKPAAPVAEDVLAMQRLAERSGSAHAVAFELRWLPEHATLIDLADRGDLGAPVLVQITRNVSMWHPSAGPVPPWKFQLPQGGGFVNAVLAHDIDLLARLYGPPEAVCASMASRSSADAEDTAALLLRLKGGAMASISGTAMSPRGSMYELEATSTSCSVQLRLEADGPSLTVNGTAVPLCSRMPSRPLAIPGSYPLYRQVRAMALLLEDWRLALESSPSQVPGFAAALLVQQVIDAARASAAGAGWVDLA